MKKFLKLFFVLICLSTFAQTNFSNPLFLNGTQNTFDRNFRVLGLDQNNEVKSMHLSTALIDTSTASWCDLVLYPNNYAFRAKYRLKDYFAEIEIINLVPSTLLPTEKLINLPAVVRPVGNTDGLFFMGYGIYSNTPIMFKISSAGDVYLLSNSTSTQNEPFNATFQYKIF